MLQSPFPESTTEEQICNAKRYMRIELGINQASAHLRRDQSLVTRRCGMWLHFLQDRIKVDAHR
jgi:hypothetical protein